MGLMEPERKVDLLPNGSYRWTITPPAWSGFSQSIVILTEEQTNRALAWIDGRFRTIQEALPDLSADDREVILSGIGKDEWDAAYGDDE